ncbi:serine/threonine-protein kinase MARK2-like [Glossophaga mutica]
MTGDFPTLSDNEESCIGGYVLLRPIGEGSFAEVILARHLMTGTEVAVKIISRQKSTKSYQEVTSLKMLNHPNIIKLFEVISTHSHIFLFMENVSGGHLLHYLLKNYPMTEEDARAKFRQMASAVQYCHHKEIAHRDLKLENILLDRENNVKVADFGFSTKISDDKLRTFCGTLSYMAPEILKLEPYDGRKADTWSLGVILYAMVMGTLPFKKTSFAEQKRTILSERFHIPDTVSVECQELLKKLLTVDPSHRITVDGIMADQWVNIGYEEPLRPFNEPPGGDIDPRVIEIMENLGYEKEEIEDSVSQRKYDDIMGTYMILENRENKMVGHTIKPRVQDHHDNFPERLLLHAGWGPSFSLWLQP